MRTNFKVGIVSTTIVALAGMAMGAFLVVGHFQARKFQMSKLPNGRSLGIPASTISFEGRPVDMAVDSVGQFAYLKLDGSIEAVNLTTGDKSNTSIKGGTSQIGMALLPSNSQGESLLAVSNAASEVVVYKVTGLNLSDPTTYSLPSQTGSAPTFPCGLNWLDSGSKLMACLSESDEVAILDLKTGTSQRIKTEPAPFAAAVDSQKGLAVVSCLGANPEDGPSETSANTKIAVDKRGIATHGSLCVIDLNSAKVIKSVPCGALPAQPVIKNGEVFVCDSGSDDQRVYRLSDLKLLRLVRLSSPTEYGLSPNAEAFDNQDQLLAACGGANQIRLYNPKLHQIGLCATPHYPIAVAVRGNRIIFACTRGLNDSPQTEKGKRITDSYGTVSVVSLKDFTNPSASTASRPAQPQLPPQITHVVYIVKENRTYDQVFGDMADGEPAYAMFGKKVTPNEHALASRFGLLTRYFCDSVISTDGHAWATEANSNSYIERSFGGWTRTYPWGDDPLAISRSGAIWDDVIDHHKTFRNYGEYVYADLPSGTLFTPIYNLWKAHKTIHWTPRIKEKRLWAYSDHAYPGWQLAIPDQYRADEFIRDFKSNMKAGKEFPDLSFVYLDQDHTNGQAKGMATPVAMNADNDLAVGRVVDAVSHSKYWKSTAIFVIEDDPQDGVDHIDGSRSICLVISPYSRQGSIIRTVYDQAALLHTIEAILKIPPMTRFDRNAPVMTACFQSRPNLAPFDAVAPQTRLDLINGGGHKTLQFGEPDENNDAVLNLQIWNSVFPNRPYGRKY